VRRAKLCVVPYDLSRCQGAKVSMSSVANDLLPSTRALVVLCAAENDGMDLVNHPRPTIDLNV